MKNKQTNESMPEVEIKSIFKWHNALRIEESLNSIKGFEDYKFIPKNDDEKYFFINRENQKVILDENGELITLEDSVPSLLELYAKLRILKTNEMFQKMGL